MGGGSADGSATTDGSGTDGPAAGTVIALPRARFAAFFASFLAFLLVGDRAGCLLVPTAGYVVTASNATLLPLLEHSNNFAKAAAPGNLE